MSGEFRALRRRLTALAAAVIAVVLVALTFILLQVFASDARSREEASFQADIGTVYQSLQLSVISHSTLRRMEAQSGVLLRVLDGGEPLIFQQLSEDEDKAALLNLAEQTAALELGIDIRSARAPKSHTRHEEFFIETDGGYLGSAALIPKNGGTLGVVVLHPLAAGRRRVLVAALIFAGLDLAAFLLLTFFFWYLAGRFLRPLEVMQIKQREFVAAASHELRSPLAVMLSGIDAVQNGSLPADGAFLGGLREEGERMSRLIGDMLTLANADTDRWTVRRTEVQVDTLLLNVYEAYEPLARAKGLAWTVLLPEDALPPLLCDKERIRQLLGILIDNAFSYTQKGGSVRLILKMAENGRGELEWERERERKRKRDRKRAEGSARRDGRALLISVADSGPGIPDDKKEAVFDRFYRMDSSRNDRQHFGLGLSIAREIASLHKGEILLEDTPGGGATFTVVLPL